ncbi:hypothetical protein [Silvimonas amylolytica]|nr:hypothetical protein [Silvimonas amylolytica]
MKCLPVLIMLASLSAIACAKENLASVPVMREVQFDACHFRLKDAYGGDLSATKYSTPAQANYSANFHPKAKRPFETSIQFSCMNPVTPEALSDRAGIIMTSHGWALDRSPDNIGPKTQHTTFQPLNGKGWKGGGVTQDDINGDEANRRRVFAFCIPHGTVALCGVARHVAYLRKLKESVLPQTVQLLESIEFIGAPANAQASGVEAAHP